MDLFPEQSDTRDVAAPSHFSPCKRVSQSDESIQCKQYSTQKSTRISGGEQSVNVCSVCFTQICDDSNWCPTCGELLLGSSLCYDGHDTWKQHGIAFSSAHPQTNVWYTGCGTQTNDYSSSYGTNEYSITPSNCPSYTCTSLPSVALEKSFTAASSIAIPLFSTSFSNLSHPTEVVSSVIEPPCQNFRVAENSISPCYLQMGSLQSTLADLNLNHEKSVDNANHPKVNSLHCDVTSLGNSNPLLSTLASLPDSQIHPRVSNLINHPPVHFPSGTIQTTYRGRQRCTSGPVDSMGPSVITERPNMPHLSWMPLTCPVGAWQPSLLPFNAPQFYTSFSAPQNALWCSQFESAGMSSEVLPDTTVHGCHVTLTCMTKTIDPINDNRILSCEKKKKFTAATRRRKNPSECSRLDNNPGFNVNSVAKNSSRSRSFTSDLRVCTTCDDDVGVPSLYCNWHGGDKGWTAQNPSTLKNKSNVETTAASSAKDGRHQTRCNRPTQPSGRPHPSHSRRRRIPGRHTRRAWTSSFVNTNVSQNSVDTQAPESVHTTSNRCVGNLPKTTQEYMDPTVLPDLENQCIVTQPPNWESLPTELWLAIIRHLSFPDRARLALVCRRLSNLVIDPSLWRVIQLNRHQNLTDAALASIGRLRPRELRLAYCHGDRIAAEGLRQLFETCGPCLRKLSFIGCTKGLFDYDLLLLMAAKHCPNMSHINASYTQAVRDHTVIALAKSALHLVSVKLNGAQQISNAAIQQLVHYHKDTLQRLELFGCFRLNSDIFTVLGRCQKLRALAFGHLHHLSSDGLLELVGKLPLLASLDLRGTQTLADDLNLARLADKCPNLEEVVLANMHSLKHEAGIAEMLRHLPRLRVLDLCGLGAVGDVTMEALANGCPLLEELDVSCTSVTQKGLSHLTLAPAKRLRCLRISHCREITKSVLEKLVQACSKLTLLYAYGFKSIADWSFLQVIRPTLLVESDG